jgi:L-alanine-DL-glutamate epimerase-like enolase superfamily enzyme
MAVTQDACDAFNIRISKCGGLVSSVRLIDFALRHGIAYQIGVQVAEVGPLINASRTMAFFYGRHFTAESGQSDRFFDTFVVSPAPAVDRKLNRISRPTGVGFGLTLNNEANVYAVNSIASNQGAK